jgi:S-disulfanyl-L-cysteine oxidoreductase SoxD
MSRFPNALSLALFAGLAFGLTAADAQQAKVPAKHDYGIGRVATPAEIAGWDIDVRPDGKGLPPGHGSVAAGEKVYMEKCAACHGEFGEGNGRWPELALGRGTLSSDHPLKTVGSYFPYLSTVFDYVRHAMPFGDAQSLSNDELYSVVAYLLFLNDLADKTFVLDRDSFRTIKLPNANGFIDDDRTTAEKAFWNANPCMKDCKAAVKITGHARVIDVTPEEKKIRETQ